MFHSCYFVTYLSVFVLFFPYNRGPPWLYGSWMWGVGGIS
jgi:hypothetical protein